MKLSETSLRRIVHKLIKENTFDVDVGYVEDLRHAEAPEQFRLPAQKNWASKEPTQKEMEIILDLHSRWLHGRSDGQQAILRGIFLVGVRLPEVDLRKADLHDANLRGAILNGANLAGANLSRTDFDGARLRAADLSGADLKSANFSCADLRSARLNSADLTDADFSQAILSFSELSGAKFTTELLFAMSVANVLCNEEQVSKLIAHNRFSRQSAD